jgi:hypothetical protein
LKRLEDKPFDFGEKENVAILIEDVVKSTKNLPNLGLKLVHEIKRETRKPIDRLSQIMKKCDHLRKDMGNILRSKAKK